MPKPRVFISATSGDLGTIRERIKQALLTLRCDPEEQRNFAPDYRTVEEMLRAKIKRCHAVVHIAGLRCGAEPSQRIEGQPRRSYTQMEYHIARELKKPVYTFVCGSDFPYDVCEPEDADKKALQDLHRKALLGDTRLFEEIRQKDDLDRKVREIDYRSHLRWTTRTLAGLSILILAVAVASGYTLLHQFRQLVPIESAERLFDAKDYAGAFHAYVRLSDRDPANLDLHRRIEECARKGHLEKAYLERYLFLAGNEPNNAIYLNYLGNAHLMVDPQDRAGEAGRQYEAAVRADPQFAPPLINLGIIAFRNGDRAKAEELLTQYLALCPEDAVGWTDLGLLYASNVEADSKDAASVEAGLRCLNRARRIDTTLAAAHEGLGRILLAVGRRTEALQAYQYALALNDDQPDVRAQVEMLAQESGDGRSPAIQLTTRAMTTGTNAPLVGIILQLLDEGQFQQAEALGHQWITASPGNPLAYRLLGRACEGQGRTNEARTAYDEASRILQSPGSDAL